MTAKLPVGSRISLTGFIQSRDYLKRLTEEKTEIRTAYEISVCSMEVFSESEEVRAMEGS